MVKPISENMVDDEEKAAGNIGPKTESCKYRGVRKRKWGKWVSEIRLPNSRERIWLGSYDSSIKAARAFDAAQFCLRGEAAKFNFPDNPPEIPGGRSLSCSQIQLAAARFANSSLPEEERTSSMDGISARSELTSFGELGSDLDSNSIPSSSSDQPFLDSFANSANFGADYGIFPGFDELNYNRFIAPSPPEQFFGGIDYYEEENIEGVLPQDFFLWNF